MVGLETSVCLDEGTIIAFVAGRLPPLDIARVDMHLDRCPDCIMLINAAVGNAISEGVQAPVPESEERFEWLEFIAEGAMGTVYRAFDRQTRRIVAVKHLKHSFAARDAELLARFLQESEILRRLDHPNIVRIITSLHRSDGHEIVMEYVPGGSLRELLTKEGRVAPNRVLALLLELADALGRAHHQGIIHRDIKPENILLAADGTPRLTDFGLARFADHRITDGHCIVGTVPYLSPEALAGLPLDERTDIWSLGVVLFEMLAGHRPFRGEHPASVMSAILSQPVPDLTMVCPEAPVALIELTQQMLTRNRDERINSSRHVAALLEAIRRHQPKRPEWRTEQSSRPQIFRLHAARDDNSSTLVGRRSALMRLHELLQRARKGERQTVFVTGEAGIGKTALVNAFLRDTRQEGSCMLAQGQCIRQYGAGEPYLPILEAVGRMWRQSVGENAVGLLRRHAPTWLAQLSPWDETEAKQALKRPPAVMSTPRRMLRELAEFTDALSRDVPLVLVLEDLHWADHSTLDLIAYLGRRSDPAQLLVLATFRPSEVNAGDHSVGSVRLDLQSQGRCHELPLDNLTPAAVAEYLTTRLPERQLPTAATQLLHRRTSGNPLFLTRLVDLWVQKGFIDRIQNDLRLAQESSELMRAVPETLREMIRCEGERLPPTERSILRAASVAGIEFSTASVAAALGEEIVAVEEICSRWARRGQFIRLKGTTEWPDSTMALNCEFIHEIYQQVTYDEIPAPLQATLHRRIGERKQRGYHQRANAIATDLAFHFERGRDFPQAIKYLQTAGNQALQRSACREAIDQFTKALQLVTHLQCPKEKARAELELQIAIGSPLAMTHGFSSPDVRRVYERATILCAELEDVSELLPIRAAIRNFQVTRGDFPAARAVGEQFLSQGELEGNARARLEGNMTMSLCCLFQGELERAERYVQAAVASHAESGAPRSGSFSVDPHLMALRFGALVLWMLGHTDQALHRAKETLVLAQYKGEPFDVAVAWSMVVRLHSLRGDLCVAQREAEAAVTFCTEQDFSLWRAIATIEFGAILCHQGERGRGLRLIDEGWKMYRSVAADVGVTYFLGTIAAAYIEAGRTEDARDVLTRAFKVVNEKQEYFWEPELYRLTGELMLTFPHGDDQQPTFASALNMPASADAFFVRAFESASKIGAKSLELRAAMSLARLRRGSDQAHDARRLLTDSCEWFIEGLDTPALRNAKAFLESFA